MGLTCRLFRGDKNLEACLVQDAAHLTQGTVGDHVAKIQFALQMLDGLQIDPAEIAAKIYGRSTAAAVLAYKKKRGIINYSYQTRADEIVGKMTIASLDREMRATESRHHNICCGDPIRSHTALSNPDLIGMAISTPLSGSVAAESFPKILNVYWSITRIARSAGNKHLKYADMAGDLVSQFGMIIAFAPMGPYQDIIPNDDIVDPRFDSLRIRQASENLRPGFPSVLRVISCPFVDFSDAYAVTEAGTVGNRTFPDFILINVKKFRGDQATLLHEMIHATGLFKHDEDAKSVFSLGSDRTVLTTEHARRLSKAFFSSS